MYLLDLPAQAIDSRRFEESSESGRARLAAGDPVGAAHELRSALQLWRGTSLPDLAGVPGAAASVARLQSLRLSTLADRIDAESLLGRHSRLIPELADLVRKHPLNERFVGQLMTSLYWEGRQAEALAAYATAADRLGDELGIDPGPALRELHGRMLRQEVGPISTAPAVPVAEQPAVLSRITLPAQGGSGRSSGSAGSVGSGGDSDSGGMTFAVNRPFSSRPGRIPGQRSGRTAHSSAPDATTQSSTAPGRPFNPGHRLTPGAFRSEVADLADLANLPDLAGLPLQGGRAAHQLLPKQPAGPDPAGERSTGPGETGPRPGSITPRPPTLSIGHLAPVLPGVAEAGGIAPIGTKRMAFGAAFGASTIGRAGELATALDLLRSNQVRVLTFVGPGGAGKTRLAAQVVARRLAEAGRAREAEATPRVVVIPLGGTSPSDEPGRAPAEGLAARLRRVLGVVPDRPAEPAVETVGRALAAGGPCLLVLDDLDGALCQGGDGAATVQTLVSQVPGLTVLATSRRALGLPGEQVVGLGPLPLPWASSDAGDVETVRSSEAVRLFTERARAVLPAFEVNGQNAAAVGALCRTLDGLPLALELAAARSRGRATAEIGSELAAAIAAQGGPGEAVGPQRVLDAVLDWTVQSLEETERLVLAQLSVFVGGATLDAAERVCGPVQGPGQVIDVIGRLADKNLLLIDETGRLGLLTPVREHARRVLARDEELEAGCADRHARYYAEFADALPPMTDRWLEPVDAAVGAAQVRAVEFDNLAAAARHAEGRDGEVFSRLVVALIDQGATTGRWEIGDVPAWLARAQALRPAARTSTRMLLAGGGLAVWGGSPATAADLLSRIPAAVTSGEAGKVMAIRVALLRAVVARSRGQLDEALAELESAVARLRTVRRLPDVLWHAVVNTVADVLDDLGRTGEAIGYWQRSRHRAAASGDSARLAYPLAMLAGAAYDRGEERLARVLIAQARSAVGQSEGPTIRAGVGVASGVIDIRSGDLLEGAQSLRRALIEAHSCGRFFVLPRIAGLLGGACRQSDPERAAALLAASAAWCAERSIVVTGRTERELIDQAQAELTHASRPSAAVRRAAARGAAVPFGSLSGLIRIGAVAVHQDSSAGEGDSNRVIDLDRLDDPGDLNRDVRTATRSPGGGR